MTTPATRLITLIMLLQPNMKMMKKCNNIFLETMDHRLRDAQAKFENGFDGKTGGTEAVCRGDPLFFRFFPSPKNGGGDKTCTLQKQGGVGVDILPNQRE